MVKNFDPNFDSPVASWVSQESGWVSGISYFPGELTQVAPANFPLGYCACAVLPVLCTEVMSLGVTSAALATDVSPESSASSKRCLNGNYSIYAADNYLT